MSKESSTWYSHRLHRRITLTRWGEVGTPVLIFPTAGGDSEEGERFYLVDSIAPLLDNQRVKVYSVDSIAGKAWLEENSEMEHAARVQNDFDAAVVEEIVPAIRQDCGHPDELPIIATGASIGAFNALAAVCRHPEIFHAAICMSGTFDVRKFLKGSMNHDFFRASPLHFVPELPEDSDQLAQLRERFILIAHGTGRWEDPAESWNVAQALGARGVPNRVDEWGDSWDHDWITWRDMLPKFLDQMVPARA